MAGINNLDLDPEIPVYRPQLKHMANFMKYIDYLYQCGAHRCGAVKVLPPKGWQARFSRDYDDISVPVIQQQFLVQNNPGFYHIQTERVGNMSSRQFEESGAADVTPLFDHVGQLEVLYFSGLGAGSPLYGMDAPGTHFDISSGGWNLSRLENDLDLVAGEDGMPVPGCQEPYLYYGKWQSTFGPHLEDNNCGSVNYSHYGAPKVWYIIPPNFLLDFEKLMTKRFPAASKKCGAFLRHKETMVDPSVIRAAGIPVSRVLQEENTFIITFEGSYHFGFNAGSNCHEAINFAHGPSWVEHGLFCSICRCVDRAPVIEFDMTSFVRIYRPHWFSAFVTGSLLGRPPWNPKSTLVKARSPSHFVNGDEHPSFDAPISVGTSDQFDLLKEAFRQLSIAHRQIQLNKEQISDQLNQIKNLEGKLQTVVVAEGTPRASSSRSCSVPKSLCSKNNLPLDAFPVLNKWAQRQLRLKPKRSKYLCSKCDYKTSRKSHLKFHFSSSHQESEKQFNKKGSPVVDEKASPTSSVSSSE